MIEAVVIALAVLIAGGSLVIPVAVFTFLASFIPFVGAILAGVVAVPVVAIVVSVMDELYPAAE